MNSLDKRLTIRSAAVHDIDPVLCLWGNAGARSPARSLNTWSNRTRKAQIRSRHPGNSSAVKHVSGDKILGQIFSAGQSRLKKKPRLSRVFFLVAGAGFEPATFGL
jgi:hypothetical protein